MVLGAGDAAGMGFRDKEGEGFPAGKWCLSLSVQGALPALLTQEQHGVGRCWATQQDGPTEPTQHPALPGGWREGMQSELRHRDRNLYSLGPARHSVLSTRVVPE